MERLVRKIEELTGEQFLLESFEEPLTAKGAAVELVKTGIDKKSLLSEVPQRPL